MKMSEVFTLPLVMKESGDTFNGGVCYFENNGDQFFAERQEIEAICRAVNEYDEARELLGEWQEWWDASQNYTNPEEMNMPPDPRKRTCKFLGDES